MSETLTHGVRVSVRPEYLPQQSHPGAGRYLFAYHVRIRNEGEQTVQLLSRRWLITNGRGQSEEVVGPGVIGEQPTLAPGEAFDYSSGCPLDTPVGTMQGHYVMQTPDGSTFHAIIGVFRLAAPGSLH